MSVGLMREGEVGSEPVDFVVSAGVSVPDAASVLAVASSAGALGFAIGPQRTSVAVEAARRSLSAPGADRPGIFMARTME